jgi:hypothetical protein
MLDTCEVITPIYTPESIMKELTTKRNEIWNLYNMIADYDLQDAYLLEIQAIDKRISVLRRGN